MIYKDIFGVSTKMIYDFVKRMKNIYIFIYLNLYESIYSVCYLFIDI